MVPYAVATDMDSPNPTEEEYPHTNTQRVSSESLPRLFRCLPERVGRGPVEQAAMIAVAYPRREDFKPAYREPIQNFTHWDSW